jgi:hypothetical protein
MTTQLSAALKVSIAAAYLSQQSFGEARDVVQKNASVVFTDGNGAGQANKIWRATRTLVASATEELDLAGVLADSFGNVLTFASVKAIMVSAAAANTNNVIVGGAATNAVPLFGDVTDTVAVPPGGVFALGSPAANGWPVTAATADKLKIANSAGSTSVTYDIVIIGD